MEVVGLPAETSALLLVVMAIVLLLSMVTTTFLSYKQVRDLCDQVCGELMGIFHLFLIKITSIW